MNEMLYSTRLKLSDMIAADPTLLSIVERLDIRLGFGDASVEEVCKRYAISPKLFVAICNIYSFPEYVPALHELSVEDLSRIVDYLRASHRYYTEVSFPHLHEMIHRMAGCCDSLNSNLINRFYDDYDAEVSSHFDYEERVVFPYIERLVASPDSSTEGASYNIEQFRRNHSNIEEKLADLKNILLKYLPEACSCRERIETLTDIFRIEQDLDRHTLIENKILIPLVAKLEKQ